MYSKSYIIAVAALSLAMCSCNEHHLPDNPTIGLPISSLVLNVSGEDFTAVPVQDDNHELTDILNVLVKVPSTKAHVSAISLAPGFSCNLKAGDEVEFVNDKLVVNVNCGGVTAAYTVEMSFNPPPIMYAIKSGDRDEEGSRYFMDVNNPTILASSNYDNYYEGEINLTASNWDNVGLVSADLSTIYHLAAGPWPAVSYYTWTAGTKPSKGDGFYPCEGPWNDWRVTNGNREIVSPGVWRIVFDSSKNFVEMTETQWAVTGNALSGKTAMNYDADTRTWNLTANLSSGEIAFETIPVTFGDPVYSLGYKENILGQLAPDGTQIIIDQAGNYNISLKLSNPPYYTFTIDKN